MNRNLKSALLGALCLFVTETQAIPVDANLLKKIADGFRCSVSDFVAVGATLKAEGKPEPERREGIFKTLEVLNSQISKQCKASVLFDCCKAVKAGQSDLYGFGHHADLTGPIEALGIKSGFVEGYLASNPAPRTFETTVIQDKLRKGVECFVKHID